MFLNISPFGYPVISPDEMLSEMPSVTQRVLYCELLYDIS